MIINMAIGLIIGIALVGAGYFVRTKVEFSYLAGFKETWEPINKERLANRIGILIIILGVIAILTSIFILWFGAIVEKISGVLAFIDVILIIIAIGLDRMGH
ncbi:hypothetical protein [Oceanobacillus sp. FSL W7-1293]|uniref:hypothetical protein n=1 Tax=Oceanobacillus sp. FSL W7-1293 TaxID=2921699 RepID=UPI0030CB728B